MQNTPPTEVPNSCNVRWSWDKFPASRVDASRTVVPLGFLYTPLATAAVPQLQYEPLRCGCGAILNPHCHVDHRSKTWGCTSCAARNSFPAHYASMTEHQLPVELHPSYDTVEYVIPHQRPPPVFAIVIDTCVDAEDLDSLREFVLFTLSKLPETCQVCLITFGATVQLHELGGQSDFPRSVVLRGTEEQKPEQLKKLIPDVTRFVCNFSDAEFAITSLVEDLQRDLWPVQKDFRPMRATGAALSAAAALLELAAKGVGSVILPFISGICTEGPGQCAELSRAVLIRTHNDIAENSPNAKRCAAAIEFYDGLMRRLVSNGHSLSLLVASLDQAGIAEMKNCAQATGGAVIVTDLWKRPWLRSSLAHFLARSSEGHLALGLNATLDIYTCPQWKVMGVIGPCIGTGRRSPGVAESEVGMGGTCQWTTSLLDSSSTLSAFFEVATPPPSPATAGQKPLTMRFVQLVVRYQSPAGGDRIRVTTLRHPIQEKTNFQELAAAFDQQAAAVLMARIAVHKTDGTSLFDVLRWLDRHTIRLVSRFGEYTKDQPNTLRLAQQVSLFPAFMFHLRRSAYLAVFNSSPDETAVLRLILQRSNCHDSIVMIQPTLLSYLMNGQPPLPVPLEESSVVSDGILLFDTYFEVLVIRGDTIDAWKKQGYDQQEQYAYFRQFLEGATADAKAIVDARYLTPRYFEVGLQDPNARIFKNRVNPGRSQSATEGYGGKEGELVYTDDAPLQKFLEHLKRLAVQQ